MLLQRRIDRFQQENGASKSGKRRKSVLGKKHVEGAGGGGEAEKKKSEEYSGGKMQR